MLLYHYTSSVHVPRILRAGVLRPTGSNLDLTSEGRSPAGPPVVWLTTHDHPGAGHGLYQSVADKTEYRFTVEVPRDWPKRWVKWAKAHGSTPRGMDWLASTGGGWEVAESWWVVARPIPARYWLAVERRVGPLYVDGTLVETLTWEGARR
jgi:hypothetical protein